MPEKKGLPWFNHPQNLAERAIQFPPHSTEKACYVVWPLCRLESTHKQPRDNNHGPASLVR